ncbi:gamma-glutamylcyclotransferase family protein [Knoellia subterranea]|uniref:Gamma-glutamylcyclotransferase AIG2-like domain-containing protein n=1 Tax=Knoellia subterranea KCTC 19937 TaxID=1385521 RepID=A0A0A0JM32_9MICO|nr:gamma-glutamylcyclotransferase family protein [Knoellia subterranea]KGN37092.1 hypothetical protein N803_14590 [Knoellia subterranea KCTC 19937]
MADHLFVYGTLAPGRPNAHVLARVPGTWAPGTVRGRLLPRGWGAKSGFPGIVLDSEGPDVSGMVLHSDRLRTLWRMLDEFEGDGYERVPTIARLEDGRDVVVHIYVLASQAPT